MKKFQPLYEKLGYEFKNENLLQAALTHRSVRGANNERLEFLGDAAVNFIIAEALYHKYGKAREGELSRLRASLVKGETLALLAKQFDIAAYLRLGSGELKTGGAYRESIQADAVEAIIGAVYLDGGFEVCRRTLLNWYNKRLEDSGLAKNLKDPKTLLQENLQAHKYPLPDYVITHIEGEAHAQIFHVECSVTGLPHKSLGVGRSRRKAEQAAAKNYLYLLENG